MTSFVHTAARTPFGRFNGGALGHPPGASGGRIEGTRAEVLRERDQRVALIRTGVGQGLENEEAK